MSARTTREVLSGAGDEGLGAMTVECGDDAGGRYVAQAVCDIAPHDARRERRGDEAGAHG